MPSYPGISYSWQLPAGWTGNSTTNYIDVTVGCNSGNIVATMTGCNGSKTASLTITTSIIATGTTITGSNLVCASGSQFTIAGLVSGTNITWNASANLTPSNASSNYITYLANSNGEGWIEATINAPACGTSVILPRKAVWVGEPLAPLFEAPQSISCDGLFYVITEDNIQPVSWDVTPPLYISGSSYGRKCTVYASGNGFDGFVSITATAQNDCGSLSTVVNDIQVVCDELLLAPNPASNEVEVSLRSESAGQLQPVLITDKKLNVLIYDSQGNLVYNGNKTGNKVKISTSNLKEGIYIVDVNFNNRTYRKQLVVKH